MKTLLCSLLVSLAVLLSGCPAHNAYLGQIIQYRGENVYWEQDDFPLVVLIDDRLPSGYIIDIMKAAEHWNEALGTRVFVPVIYGFGWGAPRDTGFVTVSIAQLDERHGEMVSGVHIGSYEPGTTRRLYSNIWIDIDLDPDFVEIVMLHEFGHALTLDHDDNDCNSVMHPRVMQCRDPRITPEDIELVRRLVLGERLVQSLNEASSGERVLSLPVDW